MTRTAPDTVPLDDMKRGGGGGGGDEGPRPRWQTEEEPYVPLRYKKRTKKEKLAEFSAVRHAKPALFTVPMSLAALAAAFQRAEAVLDAPKEVWVALAALAALAFVVLLALYAARLATLGAHKLRKDWADPAQGRLMSSAAITAFLLSALMNDGGGSWNTAAEALFWVAAVPQAVATVADAAGWYTRFHTPELVTPLYLVTPLANLVAVLPLASFEENPASARAADLREVAFLFFSYALLSWLALHALLIGRFMRHQAENGVLSCTHMLQPAAPAVAAAAYRALTGGNDAFWRVLVHASLVSLAVAAEVVRRRGPWRAPFEVSWWALSFPLSAVAMAWTDLREAVGGRWLLEAVAWTLLGLASAVTLALLALTARAVSRRRVFQAADKWGPISMLIITHGVFRRSFNMMTKQLERLAAEPGDAKARGALLKRFRTTMLLLREHSEHENRVFFPFLEWCFEGSTAGPQADHDGDYEPVREMEAAVEALAGGDGGGAAPTAGQVAEAARLLLAFKKHFFKHLSLEEATLSPANRKWSNFELMTELGRRIFFMSEPHWRVLVPFYLNTLPAAKPRRRFLECLRYLVPERMHILGIFAYEGCPPAVWAEVSAAVPEIVPRGVEGWTRRY